MYGISIYRLLLTIYSAKAIIVPHRYYEVGTLAVDLWAVTFGTARRGLGEAAARPGPSSLHHCTKCDSSPINGQCIPITVLLYIGSLLCGFNVPTAHKGLTLKMLSFSKFSRNRITFKPLHQRVEYNKLLCLCIE